MKLYVCKGTWTAGKPLHAHPCGEAHKSLREAGHEPEVVRSYGFGPWPGIINDRTPRREVKELTGNYWVPLLITDEGAAIQGSKKIVAWAQDHPAHSAAATEAPYPPARPAAAS